MKLLSQKQVAVLLGVSTRTLERYRAAGEGPPYFKLGKFVRYDQTGVADWVSFHQRASMPAWPQDESAFRGSEVRRTLGAPLRD